MKLIYIGTIYPHPGGSAISGSQIINQLAKRGFDITAISPLSEEDWLKINYYNSLVENVKIERYLVPYYNTSTHDTYSEDYVQEETNKIKLLFDRICTLNKPDIVFLGRETFSPLIKILRKGNTKFILRVAGATTLGLSNNYFSDDVKQNLISDYKKADLLISPAKHMVKYLKSINITNCFHIPNGVNIEKFTDRKKSQVILKKININPKSIIISHISGLESIKRPIDFMKAAKSLLVKNDSIFFLVVGNGPCYLEMIKYAESHNFKDKIQFVGWIPYVDVEFYYNLSDIIVMPCEADTQPRVYLETMASGKTLIASNIDASREVIEHNSTGLLYEKGNIEALIDCIKFVLKSDSKRKEIGLNARKYIIENHNWDIIIDSYEQIFKNLIK